MKKIIFIFIGIYFLLGCKQTNREIVHLIEQIPEINCDATGCKGMYTGPEFVNRDDIAHQFSNKMSGVVGDFLKKLYRNQQFSKVDFSSIEMSTEGMGTGNVEYFLSIPFIQVPNKCDAFTSFDHVGGWNHTPALEQRKKQLSTLLLPGNTLNISPLKTTKEGLQEYWIQWKNKGLQVDCK